MENNDYTMLDMFFPNHRTLNEDTSAGKEAMPAIVPSVSVNNPPDNKIPADQKKIDKPEEGMPKFKCPKCMSESVETETKGKYKCSKCGQTFSVDEALKEEKGKRKAKKIVIEIETGNAAFDDDEAFAVKQILGTISKGEILKDMDLRDSNGNTVGSIKVTEK